MSKLKLNFYESTARREPTKSEIAQIEGLALGIEAIVKALKAYVLYYDDDTSSVCAGACNVLELLIDPIIEYMSTYAGDIAPEEFTGPVKISGVTGA